MSSDKKANRDYQTILKQAEDFHNNPEGISIYQGVSQSDKITVRQNNIEILFLIRLCEKFDYLLEQIHSLENRLATLEKTILQKGKGVEGPNRPQSQIIEEDIAKYFEKLKLPPKKSACRVYRK